MVQFKRIIIDGPDNAGKTFLINKVKENLDFMGVNSKILRFPSDKFRQSELWDKVANKESYDMEFIYEWVKGIIKDVVDSVHAVIYENCEEEGPFIILEDRGMLSTMVYQFRMMVENDTDLFDTRSEEMPQGTVQYTVLSDEYRSKFEDWCKYICLLNDQLINYEKMFEEEYFLVNSQISLDQEDNSRNESATDVVFESKKQLTKLLYFYAYNFQNKPINLLNIKRTTKPWHIINFYENIDTKHKADIYTMSGISKILQSVESFVTKNL